MKKIRTLVFAVIVIGVIAWAYSARPENSMNSTDPSVGAVKVGQSVSINGVRITLNSVVQDSRCPIDVQCIQAGAINTNVTFQSGTDTVTRNMPSDEVPLSFNSYKISIVDINPPRHAGTETRQDEYVITFKVVPNQ